MSHLTDEQIEERMASSEELTGACDCADCARRVRDALAIRDRLRHAFAGVHADVDLRQRVLKTVQPTGQDQPARPRWLLLRKFSPTLAAAAVLALAATIMIVQLSGPQPASAASAELAQIHQANLRTHAQMDSSADPQKVADYFKKKLGFEPAVPRLGAGMNLRGCCVAYFRDKPVGSYVLGTDRGVISIIVLRDRPASLNFSGRVSHAGRQYHTGAFASNRLVAADRDGYTYCAVGETDANWLVELLDSLLVKN